MPVSVKKKRELCEVYSPWGPENSLAAAVLQLTSHNAFGFCFVVYCPLSVASFALVSLWLIFGFEQRSRDYDVAITRSRTC